MTVSKREQILEILTTPRSKQGERLCDAPECQKHGDFRAPKSRDDLNNYFWFCMEHIRAYNARWNFYAGLSQTEIENQLRADTTWWRPTWPLGTRAGSADPLKLDLNIFGDDDWERNQVRSSDSHKDVWRPRPGSPESEAMAVMDIDGTLTKDDIKERYKTLVKQNHPDTHGGDRKAEERLKIINRAYSTLMACEEISPQ